MLTCENCENQHTGNYGSGRFCTPRCARSFSTKLNRDAINEKVSRSFSLKPKIRIEKLCDYCNAMFEVAYNKRYQKTCSRTCSAQLKWKNTEYRECISNQRSIVAYRRHASGEDFGWRTRDKMSCSYPESIAMRILEEIGISYVKELRVSRYFIDFACVDQKIAIEIDGQQHKQEERVKSDQRKDAFLLEQGWTIHRIKWPDENIRERIVEIFK